MTQEDEVMNWRKKRNFNLIILLTLTVSLFFSGGCAEKGLWSSGDEALDENVPENVPYYADDFRDILIPNELQWDREGSMAIKTESFAGGILKFTGRVEVNSLTDFFVNTMAKNKWKLVGSAKYKNILLAFTKPYKTAVVTIFEADLTSKTTVQIYVADDITARKGYNPFAEETLR